MVPPDGTTLKKPGIEQSTCDPNIEKVVGNHRTDIRNPKTGLCIELQHSQLSVQVIQEREKAYENLIWIFNARTEDTIYGDEKVWCTVEAVGSGMKNDIQEGYAIVSFDQKLERNL